VPNLVDGFRAINACIKAVWKVQDKGVIGTDVLVGMDNPGRHGYENRIVFSDVHNNFLIGRAGAILP
jgi:hypothetical protein